MIEQCDAEVESVPALARDEHVGNAGESRQSFDEMRRRVLAFEAPYVIDKLLSAGVVESAAEAARVFTELKKYLLLSTFRGTHIGMHSARVDAAWHQFVLFTREYRAFCLECLGVFCHHVPEQPDRAETTASDQFFELYRDTFGELPELWSDARSLEQDTCLRRQDVRESWYATRSESKALLLRRDGGKEQVLCRTNQRVLGALEFIAEHPRFSIRELRALESPHERLELTRPLVQHGILILAI